ncbi:hypothetical protein [Achromobacter xylosoxidans]|uniref:hypothetical protein n=1 Tax=Alcaligenes xylosoxydans xylosoxydans TaxID=85698 RepID=UPI0038FC3921
MTNHPNSAAQAATQHPIDEAICLLSAEAESIRECHTPGCDRNDWTGESEAKAAHDNMMRVAAALSKLRSPVADERAAFKKCHSAIIKALASIAMADGPDTRKADDPELLYRSPVMDDVVRIRVALDECSAALASAPVADRQRLRELVDVVWNEATESTAVPDTPWADRLIDKVFPSLAASAPVAGEAQPLGYVMKGREWPNQCYYPSSHKPTDIHNWTPVFDHAAPQASECECSRKSKAVSDSEAQL